MAWGDGRVYRGAWVQSKCTGFGILTHADGLPEPETLNSKPCTLNPEP